MYDQGCKKNGYAFEIVEEATNYWVLKAEEQWVDFIQYGTPKQAEKPRRVQCGRGKCAICYKWLFTLNITLTYVIVGSLSRRK